MPEENRFVKRVLDNYFNEPMELDLLPDNRIVFIERKGAIKLYDPETERVKTLTNLDVYSGEEDGLIGLAISPDFDEDHHIFLCYSHPSDIQQNVSRFTFDPTASSPDLVLSDEVVVLSVPTQRDECCHSGGSLEFDHQGYLWASFGDNTNPHFSEGHSPLDDRAGRVPYDAQKSSSNTNDLRGKIIRIDVNDDGTYDIPEGNLFAKDGSEGRPEIYIMGCRNPFRYSIDSETGAVYWGEIGPDADEDTEGRGPMGYDEINQAKGPGFYGWPYFIADNKAYNDWDFAADQSGAVYDPLRSSNTSPNNTGAKDLPPAQGAMIWYPYAKSDDFPLLGSGARNAMAGPVYHADKYPSSPNKYPAYYDDKLFIYDWMRGWMMAVSFDENGDYQSMEPFLPSTKWNNLMDVVMSPDGDLYTLEYGSGWFSANENAYLSHLSYNPANRNPVAQLAVSATAEALPMKVTFDASESFDQDGEELSFDWDFGDGETGQGSVIEHIYTTAGIYTAQVTIKDESGTSTTEKIKILAGNAPPKVAIHLKGNQRFYFPGQPLEYEVVASDTEDGDALDDQIALTVDYLEMGHDLTSIAQGHMALSEIKSTHPGIELISNSDCVSCHKVDGTSVGPSYTAISTKYLEEEGQASSKLNYLAEKIVHGGGGVWGETAMAAHPDISIKDAGQMADYILSLNDKNEVVELAPSGSYVLDIPQEKSPGGNFVLMASYTDKGANGIEPLRAFANIVLRPSTIPAVEFDFADKASKFKVTKEMVPDLEAPLDIVILNDGAELIYEEIDFTGISSVIMTASAPAMFAAGGTYEIFLDDSDVAHHQGEISTSMSMGDAGFYAIPVSEIEGVHDMIVKFKGARAGGPIGTLMSWTFMP